MKMAHITFDNLLKTLKFDDSLMDTRCVSLTPNEAIALVNEARGLQSRFDKLEWATKKAIELLGDEFDPIKAAIVLRAGLTQK